MSEGQEQKLERRLWRNTMISGAGTIASALILTSIYWVTGSIRDLELSQRDMSAELRLLSVGMKSSIELHGVNLLAAVQRINRLEQENEKQRERIDALMTRIRAESR